MSCLEIKFDERKREEERVQREKANEEKKRERKGRLVDIVGANNEIYMEERRQFEGGGCDVYLLVVFLTNIGF